MVLFFGCIAVVELGGSVARLLGGDCILMCDGFGGLGDVAAKRSVIHQFSFSLQYLAYIGDWI